MRGPRWQPSVSGCARMRALPSTCATHQARGTDRQLHCPHLTWQAVTARSDRSVPGLFICCRWERSWVGQIALHTERQPSLLWSASNRVRAQPRCVACHRTSCAFFFFSARWEIKRVLRVLFIDDKFMLSVVWQWAPEIYPAQREVVFSQVKKQVSVHSHSQWNSDVRVSRGCPGPAVPAA